MLAVEVSGPDEPEGSLREKARWYLDMGVAIVWLVLTDRREVVVITRAGETRHGMGERIPADPRLPDLAPMVEEFFRQVGRVAGA